MSIVEKHRQISSSILNVESLFSLTSLR